MTLQHLVTAGGEVWAFTKPKWSSYLTNSQWIVFPLSPLSLKLLKALSRSAEVCARTDFVWSMDRRFAGDHNIFHQSQTQVYITRQ